MLNRTLLKNNQIELPVVTFKLPSSDFDESKLIQMATTAFSEGITMFDIPAVCATIASVEKMHVFLSKLYTAIGNRDKLLLSGSLTLTKETVSATLEGQLSMLLKNVGTSYLDFVRVVIPTEMDYDSFCATGAAAFLIRAKKEGLIKAVGFETEMSGEGFDKVASLGAWDFCAFRLNYMVATQKEPKATTDATVALTAVCFQKLAAAEKVGLGVFALSPFDGGRLARPPRAVLNVFAHTDVPRIPAEWALRWILENQIVLTAVTAMENVGDVIVNCAIGSAAFPNSLPSKQLEVVKLAASAY